MDESLPYTKQQQHLIDEIRRFAGEKRLNVIDYTLRVKFARTVRRMTQTSNDVPASLEQQTEAVQQVTDFLQQEVDRLRHLNGYIRVVGGQWIHRSLITWGVWGLCAILCVSVSLPMILSPLPWRLWWGLGSLVAVIAISWQVHKRAHN